MKKNKSVAPKMIRKEKRERKKGTKEASRLKEKKQRTEKENSFEAT